MPHSGVDRGDAISLYVAVMSFRRQKVLILSSLCLLLISAGWADTVKFRRGGSIEGVITEETDKKIVLKIGLASMTIPKSQIAVIVRSDAEERKKLQDEAREKHFLHSSHVPD